MRGHRDINGFASEDTAIHNVFRISERKARVPDVLLVNRTSGACGFTNSIREEATFGCYGASGRRWKVDIGGKSMPEGLVVNGWVRVFNHGWAVPTGQ